MSKLISVIIPAFNDAARLQLCLQGLAQQTYPDFEVIVVDNGSKDVVAHRKVCEPFDFVTFTSEATPGSYAARNKGLELARGEVLAFTDSDCIPEPDWLENGVKHLAELDYKGLVAGRLAVFPASAEHPSPVELYEMMFAFPQERYVRDSGYGVTGNMITHRQVVDKIGPFNTELMSGGDHDFGVRARAAGFGAVYAPDVCVQHPARRSFAEIKKKLRRTMAGVRDRDDSLGAAMIQFKEALKPPIKLSLNVLRSDDSRFDLTQKLTICRVAAQIRLLAGAEAFYLWILKGSSRRA